MRVIYSFAVLRGLAMGIFSPIWILYLVHQGYDLLEIGLLGAVFEIAKLIFEVPSGTFADRYGIKTSIVGSFIFSVLTWAFFPFIDTFAICISAMILWALSDALISGSYETWITRLVDENKFGKVLMKNTQLMVIGIIVGSLSSGYLYTLNPYLPFVLVVGLYLTLLIWMSFVKIPSIKNEISNGPTHKESFIAIISYSLKFMFRKRRVFLIVIAGFFTALVYDTISRYWQPYMEGIGFSEEALGFIFASAAGVTLLLLGITIKFEKKIDNNPYASLTILESSTLALTLLLSIGFKPLGMISMPILLAVEDIRHPIEMNYLNKFFPESHKATLFSLNSGVSALGEVLSGIIFGIIAVKLGLIATLIIASCCLLPAIIIYLVIPKIKDNSNNIQLDSASELKL